MSLFPARQIVSFLIARRTWLVTCHYVCRFDLYNVMMLTNITPYIVDEQSTFPIVFAVGVLCGMIQRWEASGKGLGLLIRATLTRSHPICLFCSAEKAVATL